MSCEWNGMWLNGILGCVLLRLTAFVTAWIEHGAWGAHSRQDGLSFLLHIRSSLLLFFHSLHICLLHGFCCCIHYRPFAPSLTRPFSSLPPADAQCGGLPAVSPPARPHHTRETVHLGHINCQLRSMGAHLLVIPRSSLSTFGRPSIPLVP